MVEQSPISGTEQAQAVNVALTPCPFCGGKPVLRRIVEEYEADSDGPAGEFDARFMICCDTCGIETGEEYRTEAISAWNRRSAPALPQDVAALVERLEKRADDYRQSGPSAEHSAALYDEAAAYIRSQSSIIASQADKLERTERNRDMWKGQVERQAAALASAREVIEPFAQVANAYDDREDDDYQVWMDIGISPEVRVASKLKNFRAAREWKETANV